MGWDPKTEVFEMDKNVIQFSSSVAALSKIRNVSPKFVLFVCCNGDFLALTVFSWNYQLEAVNFL